MGWWQRRAMRAGARQHERRTREVWAPVDLAFPGQEHLDWAWAELSMTDGEHFLPGGIVGMILVSRTHWFFYPDGQPQHVTGGRLAALWEFRDFGQHELEGFTIAFVDQTMPPMTFGLVMGGYQSSLTRYTFAGNFRRAYVADAEYAKSLSAREGGT